MWIQYVQASFSIVTALVSVTCFIMIKVNDIKHIQIAVEKIEKAVDEIQKSDAKFKVTLAEILTRCEERHAKVKVIRRK